MNNNGKTAHCEYGRIYEERINQVFVWTGLQSLVLQHPRKKA